MDRIIDLSQNHRMSPESYLIDLISAESCSQVGVLTSPFPLNCLFQAMEREVTAAFGKGKPDEIMSSAFKLKVTREDIHTLKNLHWLNDEVKLTAAR